MRSKSCQPHHLANPSSSKTHMDFLLESGHDYLAADNYNLPVNVVRQISEEFRAASLPPDRVIPASLQAEHPNKKQRLSNAESNAMEQQNGEALQRQVIAENTANENVPKSPTSPVTYTCMYDNVKRKRQPVQNLQAIAPVQRRAIRTAVRRSRSQPMNLQRAALRTPPNQGNDMLDNDNDNRSKLGLTINKAKSRPIKQLPPKFTKFTLLTSTAIKDITHVLDCPDHVLQKTKAKSRNSTLKIPKIIALDPQSITMDYVDQSEDELRKICLDSDLMLIKGLCAKKRIDLSIYNSEPIVKLAGKVNLETRVQNYIADPDFGQQKLWKYLSKRGESTVEEQANYQKKKHENSPIEGETIIFGTNLDFLDNNLYRAQIQEIKKLPGFLQPSGNMLDAINYPIPGINRVQLYMKVAGSRTPAHQENNWLTSININIGPGDCIWYGVGIDYRKKFVDLCKNRHKVSLVNGSCWPTVKELQDKKIPYYKIVQKPGDLVFVGYGCIHWVQAMDTCNNIAWNAAPFTERQIRVSKEATKFYLREKYISLVPHERLCWAVADSNLIPENKKALELILRECMHSFAYQLWLGCYITKEGSQEKSSKYAFGEWEVDPNRPAISCEMCSKEVYNVIYILRLRNKDLPHCFHCARKIDPEFKNTTMQVLEEMKNYGKILQKVMNKYQSMHEAGYIEEGKKTEKTCKMCVAEGLIKTRK